ncbi:MAG: hypothetical protein ACE37H_17075 [Phycisphaeraceae bacterium]
MADTLPAASSSAEPAAVTLPTMFCPKAPEGSAVLPAKSVMLPAFVVVAVASIDWSEASDRPSAPAA